MSSQQKQAVSRTPRALLLWRGATDACWHRQYIEFRVVELRGMAELGQTRVAAYSVGEDALRKDEVRVCARALCAD